MKFLDILRARRAEIATEREAKVSELEAVTAAAEQENRSALNEDETERYNAVKTAVDALDEEDAAAEARIKELEGLAARAKAASVVPTSPVPGGPSNDAYAVLEDRSATPDRITDAATRALEPLVQVAEGDMGHVRKVLKRHRRDTDWARNMLARTHPTYVSAFEKVITGHELLLSDEERAFLAVGTNTQGGFLVPTHLDPTIVLTNSGTSNAIRPLARVVTLTAGNVWNGVTSAGVSASWDDEFEAVSDDTPSVARTSVPVFKAQAFVGASIEALEDIDAVASDVLMLFADARDRLEGAAHATGSGSGEPTGIFTALDANTNVELISTTAATIGRADLATMYKSVPVRWRGRSTWLMNPTYLLAIQGLGSALGASYSTDLTQPLTDRLFGKPIVESDDAPSTQTTNVNDNEVVLGDFSNYLIVDKPGSASIEFIPHIFDTSSGLPKGQRGWYLHFRSGADSINDLAFRLLQDRTG